MSKWCEFGSKGQNISCFLFKSKTLKGLWICFCTYINFCLITERNHQEGKHFFVPNIKISQLMILPFNYKSLKCTCDVSLAALLYSVHHSLCFPKYSSISFNTPENHEKYIFIRITLLLVKSLKLLQNEKTLLHKKCNQK